METIVLLDRRLDTFKFGLVSCWSNRYTTIK